MTDSSMIGDGEQSSRAVFSLRLSAGHLFEAFLVSSMSDGRMRNFDASCATQTQMYWSRNEVVRRSSILLNRDIFI